MYRRRVELRRPAGSWSMPRRLQSTVSWLLKQSQRWGHDEGEDWEEEGEEAAAGDGVGVTVVRIS
jgi:hypothetical protein